MQPRTLLFLLIAILTFGRCVMAEDTTAVAYELDDGPHVYWKNDSTAMVIYLCHDEVSIDTFTVTDTLSFRGACNDSNFVYKIPASLPQVEPDVYEGVSRILVVSDIHGEYGHLVSFLRNAGVINGDLKWAWGDGHLVIDGDIFDRGQRETECLWLMYHLEQQARLAGGRVHYVLGNHELMVMRGDNRYVHERYLNGISRKTRIRHEDFYGPDMELGRWLRTKHAIIKINDIIFVHGGISPPVLDRGWSLADINNFARSGLDLRSSELAFDETANFLFGSLGPFWYRGYHYGIEGRYESASSTEVDTVLGRFGARTIVVGHTECDEIHRIFGSRVVAIDIPVEDLEWLEGILWVDGSFQRICGAGRLWPIE